VAYTRDGGFKLDNQGRLVTSDGYLLEPELTIPQDVQHVSIGEDGTVSVTTADGQAQDLGQIQLARFLNPAGLRTIGHNLYLPTATSGDPVTGTPGENGFGSIVQGAIEKSNVKVVEEMVSMIVALRAYEVNSKAIQTADEMLSIANNVRR
jgi:flagellar basal-body rod protein FlgG